MGFDVSVRAARAVGAIGTGGPVGAGGAVGVVVFRYHIGKSVKSVTRG